MNNEYLLVLLVESLSGLASSPKQQTTFPQELTRANQPMPTPYPQPPPLWGSHTLGHRSPALATSGPGTRQLGTALHPQNPLERCTPASPTPAGPDLPVCSLGNHNKRSCPFPPTLPPPARPWCFPQCPPPLPLPPAPWCVLPHLLGSVNVAQFLFSSSYLLICWPHHT